MAETGQPYYYAGDDPVNETDPSGLNAQSGPVADGCNSSNNASCQAAWQQTEPDILDFEHEQFPGFSWGHEFTSAALGAAEGLVTGALTGCLAGLVGAGVGCIPAAIAGAVAGAIGGLVGGIISGITDQTSYVTTLYVSQFLHSTLNIIFSDTASYLNPYRDDCSNSINCVEAIALQFTPVFLVVEAGMASEFGEAVVDKGINELNSDYGFTSSINGLGSALTSSYVTGAGSGQVSDCGGNGSTTYT